MYPKFDRISDGVKDNKGSCAQFVNYMAKEDKKDIGHKVEWWFDQHGKSVLGTQVLRTIDEDWQGLGKDAAKFTTGSINPTEREWNAMGRDDEERLRNFKAWAAVEFTRELAANFHKKDKNGNPVVIAPENVKIFFKLEHNRYYAGTDEEVLRGEAKSGAPKPGFNKHIHFIIATKTADRKNRINPKTKNRNEFNRVNFYQQVEKSFDRQFGFKRAFEESYASKLASLIKGSKVDAAALAKEAFDNHQEREGSGGEEREEQEREQRKK
jgi:hypothetical protein